MRRQLVVGEGMNECDRSLSTPLAVSRRGHVYLSISDPKCFFLASFCRMRGTLGEMFLNTEQEKGLVWGNGRGSGWSAATSFLRFIQAFSMDC